MNHAVPEWRGGDLAGFRIVNQESAAGAIGSFFQFPLQLVQEAGDIGPLALSARGRAGCFQTPGSKTL